MDNEVTHELSVYEKMKKGIAWFVTVAAIALFYVTLYHALIAPRKVDSNFAPAQIDPDPSSSTSTRIGVLPKKLIIPSLNLSAQVEKVGLTAKGSIGTPSTFSTVAWYKYSAEPGASGVAIVDGHVDNGLGLSGIFKRLKEVGLGDIIIVQDAEGKELTFSVTNIQNLAYDDSGVTLVTKTGEPRIALITCEGSWIRSAQTYSKRLVVIGSLVANER